MINKCVCYHSCTDGFTAAFAAYKKFGLTAKYIPCSFGGKVPTFSEYIKTVYILDFSFPRETLERWRKSGIRIVLLDHHKTAQDKLSDLSYCKFDMSKSGCVMAWEYFHPGTDIPVLFQYVQDADLYNWTLPDSQALNMIIQSTPKEFLSWANLSIDLVLYKKALTRSGERLLDYRSVLMDAVTAKNKILMLPIAGYTVPVINTPIFISEVGNRLCAEFDTPFAATYFDRSDGMRQWSLRSVGEFDVSRIAALFGGGGHKNAAGMETESGRDLKIVEKG